MTLAITSQIGTPKSRLSYLVLGFATGLGNVPSPRGTFTAGTRAGVGYKAGTRATATYRAGSAG